MKNLSTLLIIFFALFLINCSREKKYEKGFPVGPETQTTNEGPVDGIHKDSVNFDTRPTSVLLTGIPKFRLTTIYKLNYDEKGRSYLGNNHYYSSYYETVARDGNQWHGNFMPGMEAVYGFNMVNVSLYNIETREQKNLFEKSVLIKTLYFPSFSRDTLNYKPVSREFYMISVYDEDTNKDGFINLKDLRRLYIFDIQGSNKKELIPLNYSVISSQYDQANDYMYVFAQVDENKNGQMDDKEDIHVFWIDLKSPANNGRQY